jgi:hypothetical protein
MFGRFESSQYMSLPVHGRKIFTSRAWIDEQVASFEKEDRLRYPPRSNDVSQRGEDIQRYDGVSSMIS